jgi:hypothetical protein
MKTIRLFFPLLLISSNLFSNISEAYPKVEISEIFVESSFSWSLELGFRENYDVIPYDSIVIETCAGRSKVKDYTLIDISQPGFLSSFIAVITNSDLERELEINRENDFLKVYSYFMGMEVQDFLAFGKYPGSFFLEFKSGFSIVRDDVGLFSLDKTPTIGKVNTEDGTMGVVQGYVYDRNHNPLPNAWIGYNTSILSNENGYYYTSIPSRTYYTDTIWTSDIETYIFKPDTINVFPDSTSSADLIVLSHSQHSSVINSTFEPHFLNFPNPFKNFTTFYVSLPEIYNNKTVILEIYNNAGQAVGSFQFPDTRYAIALPSDLTGGLKAGIYYYTLIIDGIPSGETKTMIKIP